MHVAISDGDPVAAGGPELAAKLASFVVEDRLPGGVAGAVHGDELAWSAAAGFADVGARRPTEPDMLYRIASITKTFTGTAVMQLRDAGRLDLDDPAVAWLPELRGATSPYGPVEAVTIRRMLSHESGLTAEPPGTDWAIPAYQGSPERTLGQASDIAVTLPPGTAHRYSDLAYQLLGEIVTRASGAPYPRYLREAILDPLGMSATRFEPLPAELPARCATGYDWRALADERDPAPPMPPVWAEGGLWSCVADLARWISFQLGAHRDPGQQSPVLAAASLREMHRPHYLADDGWTQAWGVSWCGTRQDDAIWIGHSGGLPGFTSTVCFDPTAQVGAVVLLNGTSSGSPALAMDIAAAARRLVRARPPAITPPEPVPAAYRPLLGIYARPDLGGWVIRLEWRDGKLTFTTPESAAWRLVRARPPAITPPEPVPAAYRPLLGIYARPDLGGWVIRLEWRDGKLTFTTPESAAWRLEAGTGFAAENVTFRRLPDGRVASVSLMDSTWARLDPVAAPG